MKKKLIFVAQALWIGGIETALVNLLNHLDYDRYDVTCLILRNYQDMADRLPKQCRLLIADRDQQISFPDPYTYRRMFHLIQEPSTSSKLRRAEWKLLRFGLRGLEMDRYAAYIKKQLKNEHFDTCVIYSDRCAEVAVKAVNADRFLMYYHHGAMRHELHDDYGYRKSEKIIAVSEPLARQLRAYRPKYADKIIAINNLVDVDGVRKMSLAQPETVFPKEAFNIVSCGRIAVEKGMDLAAEACAKLVGEGMTDLNWWIVGGGPAEAALREQTERLGIGDHFHILGMQKNPYPYIRQADLYVQPSRVESFGLTIMEALVLGRHVLATETYGAAQVKREFPILNLCPVDTDALCAQIEKEAGKARPSFDDQVLFGFNEKAIRELEKLL